MTLYTAEILRRDASGNLSVSLLTIDDSDNNLQSQDPFATYFLDGVQLSAPPTMFFGNLVGTALDGEAAFSPVVLFNHDGVDYYLLNSSAAPQEFVTVTSVDLEGVVGGASNQAKGLMLAGEKLYVGQSLSLTILSGLDPTVEVVTTVVFDDDNRIQFNGQNGAPNSEAGIGAQFLSNLDASVEPFNTLVPGGSMILVEVTAQTDTGIVTFEALRYARVFPSVTFVNYYPRTGSVDLSTITGVISQTTLPGSADGLTYGAFGLGSGRQVTSGDGAANYLTGSMIHDELQGKGGDDSLVGGIGADSLAGGSGDDLAFGGAQDDTLEGGDGNDRLVSGIDDDVVKGGAGSDAVLGGFGHDLLFGGTGNDQLFGGDDNDRLVGSTGRDTLTGGSGNDTLDGGTGADDLRGNGGADRFVFAADGATDRLRDFQNGSDVIDLDEAFASLTITTLAPGTVEITHSGELLIITDASGTLTAADFTAADFV